ncbi:GDSL-type esterase/lipase family protein [Planomonospora sp. ID82291]|uniref:GDSL-type esterase/lipase family protein n=1 Tax=Planomonospora sp. ID82291 TaxID=2738136 RepID=UPI0018C40309|nr:GDSL-type esterase/lipase family protein [Planomonospora sp. ID82291]MBG0816093.1 fibronectin type III domain-containing protein [Planomonospora sp. ID82291]
MAEKPDFGDEDPLSQAWKRGEISVDEYVRHSVERLAQPENIPKEYRSAEGIPHEAGLALYYALQLAEQQASPETKAWLAETFKQPDPAVARSTTEAARTPSVAAPSPWTECGDHRTHVTFAGNYFDCVHTVTTTIRFNIYYNIDGLSEAWASDGSGGGVWARVDGVVAVDTNPANGVPDAIDLMATNHTKAWGQYKAWGYGLTGQGVQIYVGFDFGGVNPNHPGVTIPTGGPGDAVAGPVILLPADPGDPLPGRSTRRDWKYTYLPYHEMFHAVQYHYLSNTHLGANLTAINWWMEATAEWATHTLYRNINSSGPKPDAYAGDLPLFLGQPELALNSALSPWSTSPKRQYGAFIFAGYLTERTGFDFVRQTWQAMGNKLPIEAIDQVLAGYGRDLKTELQGFAVANYRLTGTTVNLSTFLRAADGYLDPDASTTWRNLLTNAGYNGRPARAAEKALAWGGGSSSGYTTIWPGGTSYVELSLPATGQGRVTVQVRAPDQGGADSEVEFTYLLIAWDDLFSRTPKRWVSAQAKGDKLQHDLSLSVQAGETVTLIATRTDLWADVTALPSGAGQRVQWTASLLQNGGKVMVVGDSITNGHEGDYTWRYRLAKHFAAKGVEADFVGPNRGTFNMYAKDTSATYRDGNFDSDHFSLWGWHYADAKNKIRAMAQTHKPDYLVVALGFNDIAWYGGADNTITSMRAFIAEARAANPNLKILISNVINRSELDGWSWLNPAISEYKTKLPGVAASLTTPQSPIHLVDVNSVFNHTSDAYDGLHPNGVGEYKIAKAFADAFATRFSIGSAFGSVPSTVPEISLTAPARLTAQAVPEGIQLRWGRVYGAGGYYIHVRDVTAGEPFHQLPYPIADDKWLSGGLLKGHTYEYKITATRGDRQSGASPVASALANPQTPPQPEGVKAIPGQTSVEVTWKAIPGVTTYEVYGQDQTTGAWLPTVTVTGTSYTYTGLATDHRYNVAVAGVNAVGVGVRAAGLPAHTGRGTPPVVTGVDSWQIGPAEARINWNPSFGAVGYWIEYLDHTQANPAWSRMPYPLEATNLNPGFSAGYLFSGPTNYSFRIVAANGALEAAASAPVKVRQQNLTASRALTDKELAKLRKESKEAGYLFNRLPDSAFGVPPQNPGDCHCLQGQR